MSNEDQLAEVVRIRPGVDIDDEQRMLRIKPRDFEQRFCQHHRTELVRETERAYCVDCGQEVPLFELLQMLAQSVDKWIAYRQEAERRAKVALSDCSSDPSDYGMHEQCTFVPYCSRWLGRGLRGERHGQRCAR